MIQSILQRPNNKLSLDKIITNQPDNKIILDPEEIKKFTKMHYQKCNIRPEPSSQTITTWEQEYIPKEYINPSWYNNTIQEITVIEVKQVISKMKSESAPGKSEINYSMLKKIGNKCTERITLLFNKILDTQEIPNKWQHNILHPIPKKADWQNDLNNIRPIALLETIKKVFIKIINNRLAQTMMKHKIL